VAPLHFHPLAGRILVGPASDAAFRAWVTGQVPSQYRTHHPHLDAWELDRAFEDLLLRIAERVHGREAVCAACWGGAPCDAWVAGVAERFERARQSNPRAWAEAWRARDRHRAPEPDTPGRDEPRRQERPSAADRDRRGRAAASELGVAWPCTRAAVARAFVAAALRAHPDHGGTDDAMRRLLEARAELRRLLP
jgi:hypothetical protein